MLTAAPLSAQQRPLLSQDPEPIAPGQVMVEVGVDYETGREFPLSGLRGDIVRLPYVGLAFGLGTMVEFQVDGGFNILSVERREDAPLSGELDFSGDTSTDIEDPVISTKIRLQRETRRFPALGFLVATRLPSASNESGLGTDTIDWSLTVLGGKTIGATRIVGNFGLAVLSAPLQGDRQNDLMTLAVSVTRKVTPRWDVVAEARGRIDNKGDILVGTEERGELRFGTHYRISGMRIDAGVLIGLADQDADVGLTIGVAHAVHAFNP